MENKLVDARLNRLRKKALRMDEKIKEAEKSPGSKTPKQVERYSKKLGKAVNKYDKIMQRKDKEYGKEMKMG